jgi:O-antigen biosynthesis protein
MALSVFSPSHAPRFLDDAYESLLKQTVDDWEWVVVLNQGATWVRPDDPRVRVVFDEKADGVGAAKARAVEECAGDLVVELDHDDILASTCLERVQQAFDEHPDAALVYSETAQISEDGSRDDSMFDLRYGWEYYETDVDGLGVQAYRSMEPTWHNVSFIYFAPNHVKAFARWAYDKAGGYDPARTIADDADLMCRLYQVGEFVPIHEALYLQRVHDQMTQRNRELNARIQVDTHDLYDRYVEQNALTWARREGLLALDLGAAHGRPGGYLGVDRMPAPDVDVVCELPARLPFADGTVGVIRAMDFLEHVADKVGLMNELYRVLAPGGALLTMTPAFPSRGAVQDPAHVSWWCENSFWYFTDRNYQRYAPDVTARFQVSRLTTTFPSTWHQTNDIPYVTGNLIALREGMPRYGGIINW